ncbi:chromosomal replication initiator protein DnaA [bacterium]|nr:chromosomal replication initiator protein DnaA [bacterium]
MNAEQIEKIWEDVKKILETEIPVSSYDAWVEPLELIDYEDNQIKLLSGQAIAVEYLKKNHYPKFLEAFKQVLQKEVTVNFETDKETFDKIKKAKAKEEKKEERKAEKIQKKEEEHKKAIENLGYVQSMNLNLKYRFDNFVTDENNKMAKAAAEMVAKNPNAQYNPLYIQGGSGLGKTHLMQAIGHALIKNKKIQCVKSEIFINEYINSTARNKESNKSNLMNKFRQKYRNIDVLLIDDIQFFEGKKQCMEELFNTFDSLHIANKQIVLTSDRLPKDMPEMPQRLISRFEQGLVVEIQPPKEETRIKILKNIANTKNLTVPDSVFEYIAKNYKTNVRELEGAFNKVEAFASFEDTEITLDFAKHVLKCEERNELNIEKIAQEVSKHYGISIEDIKSSARSANISKARKITAFISKEYLKLKLEEIAKYIDKKHQTVIYACDQIKEKISKDNNLEKEVKEILSTLNL